MFGTRISQRRAVGALVCLTAAMTSLTACRSSSSDSDSDSGGPIVVGVTVPQSGALASYGVIAKGIQAYFGSVNASGGISGHKVEVKVLDDGYQAAQSLNNVRKFVQQDHASLVVGFGAITSADRDYMQSAKVPLIAINGNADMNRSEKYSYIRTELSDQRIDVIADAKATSAAHPDAKVALLSINSDIADTLADGLTRGLSGGAKLTQKQLYPATATDLTAYVNKLKSTDVTDVFINAAAPTLAATMKYIHQIGWKVRVHVFQNNASIAAAMSLVGNAATGAISSFYFKDPADPRWASDADMEKYRDIVGKYAAGTDANNLFTLVGFTTAEAAADALGRSDGEGGTKFLDAWDKIDSTTMIGYLPGVRVAYDPIDGRLFHSEQIVEFDGKSWQPVGDLQTVPAIPSSGQ